MLKYVGKKEFLKTQLSTLYKYKNYIIKKSSKYYHPYQNETNILKMINNDNIIKLEDSYEDLHHNYIVTKYYPYGDLHYNIQNNIININNHDLIINNLIDPICYIHKKNIVHLDLKLDNYLVDYKKNNEKQFILFDFNLAHIHNQSYHDLQDIPYIMGTKKFMAPEILNHKFSKASDIYSLGHILYLIYTRSFYEGKIDEEQLKDTPDKIKEIIKSCLQKKSQDRPSIFDIKHFYYTDRHLK